MSRKYYEENFNKQESTSTTKVIELEKKIKQLEMENDILSKQP